MENLQENLGDRQQARAYAPSVSHCYAKASQT